MTNTRINRKPRPKLRRIPENKFRSDTASKEVDKGFEGEISSALNYQYGVEDIPISAIVTAGTAQEQEEILADGCEKAALKTFKWFSILNPLIWVAYINSKNGKINCVKQALHGDPEKGNDPVQPNYEEDKAVESNSETDQCEKAFVEFKEGEHIAVKRRLLWFDYSHHGAVVKPMTIDGREVTMVVHSQRPGSQFVQSRECGYTGPPKNGGCTQSCLNCFKRGGVVFKIQHIGGHLLTPEEIAKYVAGKVLYRGYCNDNFYLGYFLGHICKGYKLVKRNDYDKLPVDNRVRFVETSKSSKEKVLNAAREEKTNPKPYKLFGNNCEDAAMFIMTGERRCFQLENCRKRIVWKIRKLSSFGAGVSNIVETGEPSESIPEKNEEKKREIGPSEPNPR